MYPTVLAAFLASAFLVDARLLRSILGPRGLDELWGGQNITQAALDIQSSISSPTCNSTTSCQAFVEQVVPQCLGLQGTAGCWCTLHDPLHYCAICMSSPTDNTTTSDQTQRATSAHIAYHRGCAAYQAYLNASATGSLTSSIPSTTAPLPTASTAVAASSGSSGLATGPLIGAIVGGILGLALIVAITLLVYRRMSHKANSNDASGVRQPEKEKPLGDPVRVTSYYSPGGPFPTHHNFDLGEGKPTYGVAGMAASTPPPLSLGYQGSNYGGSIPGSEIQRPVPMSLYNPDQGESMAYSNAGEMSDANSGYHGGGTSVSGAGQGEQAFRLMTTSPPPPFTPGGYDSSILGAKAGYQSQR